MTHCLPHLNLIYLSVSIPSRYSRYSIHGFFMVSQILQNMFVSGTDLQLSDSFPSTLWIGTLSIFPTHLVLILLSTNTIMSCIGSISCRLYSFNVSWCPVWSYCFPFLLGLSVIPVPLFCLLWFHTFLSHFFFLHLSKFHIPCEFFKNFLFNILLIFSSYISSFSSGWTVLSLCFIFPFSYLEQFGLFFAHVHNIFVKFLFLPLFLSTYLFVATLYSSLFLCIDLVLTLFQASSLFFRSLSHEALNHSFCYVFFFSFFFYTKYWDMLS